MKGAKYWAAAVAILVAGSITGRCADERTAVVDMSRVMAAHPRTAPDRAILEKQIGEFEAERDAMVQKLEKLQEEFNKTRREAGNKALSEKARDKSLAMAEEQLVAIREFQQHARATAGQRQKELNDQRIRMGRRVLGDVKEVISAYAKKEKIALVLDTAGVGASGVEVVLYNSGKLDITDDIVKLVEKAD